MLKTTDFKVTLENEHYSTLASTLEHLVSDYSNRMQPTRILEQVKSAVDLEVRRHNYNSSDKVTWGSGTAHIWVAQEGTGDRAIIITYQIVHKMNLQLKK